MCGMYVVQQYDTAFGCCCCSCHTSTAPVVVFYIWYECAYFGTINTYQVCESAAVCVYILLLELLLLLLLLLLLFIVHLPPEVFFMQQQYFPSLFIASCTNERSLLLKYTPWQNSRFCAASALPIILIPYLSSPIRACAKPQADVSPPRRSPSCIYVVEKLIKKSRKQSKKKQERKQVPGTIYESTAAHMCF